MPRSVAVAWLVVLTAAQNIKIDWSGSDGARTPTVDLQPHLPHLEPGQRAVGRWITDDDDPSFVGSEPAFDSHELGVDATDIEASSVRVSIQADGRAVPHDQAPPNPPAPEAASEELEDTPVASIRATLRRMGARLPASNDEAVLREALVAALNAAKTKLVRGLLSERGGSCVGCSEKGEFISAVLSSLRRPLVARHALPLFLYDTPLFPHTQMGLHLYEPRYKLLCRKALKADRIFGFVSASPKDDHGVGTLAKIRSSRFHDDDAKDGTCHMTIVGTRRFVLGRRWEEKCDGCPEPLHYADATYIADAEAPPAAAADAPGGAVGLVKESLRLHHAAISTQSHNELVERLGDTPVAHSRDRGYAMSMWLAAACVQLHEACKAHAGHLLATRSTEGRLERVIAQQKAAVAKKYGGTRRKPK